MSFMENAVDWHGKAPNDAEYDKAMAELRASYEVMEKEAERINADNKSIATRDSYGAALLELADAGHDDIVVFDADLSASTRTSVFAKKYSERFFDCGIAECNMVGVAAGMSTFGYVPFVSSFAMFAAGRAFEQIRNSIGYPELNVKIAATTAACPSARTVLPTSAARTLR